MQKTIECYKLTSNGISLIGNETFAYIAYGSLGVITRP